MKINLTFWGDQLKSREKMSWEKQPRGDLNIPGLRDGYVWS